MKRRNLPPENTPRVIALTVAFFGGAAAIAWADGLFGKLGAGETAALALFAAFFGALTYVADAQVRGAVNRAIAALRGRSARPGRTRGRPIHIHS